MTFKTRLRLKAGESEVERYASEFAIEMHGDQQHGCLKISEHLCDVAENVKKHYNFDENWALLDDVVAAAWCHDLVEDTPVTLDEIEKRFGGFVSDIVHDVTDKNGANRYERHLRTYHMIRNNPDALLVKLCDRRHNHERSIAHNERWAAMYRDEYRYFKMALWRPHQYKKLWEELDAQYEQLKRIA